MNNQFSSSGDYKRYAKSKLQNHWPLSILVYFLAGLLGGGIASTSFRLTVDQKDLLNLEALFPGTLALLQRLTPLLTVLLVVLVAACIVDLIVGGVLRMGLCLYSLDLVDEQQPQLQRLFGSMRFLLRALCLQLLILAKTLAWTMLLIVPGIVASYSYRMAFFYLAEDPSLTPTQALARSVQLMDGLKLELFMLHLSFLGWRLLNTLTLGILGLWFAPYRGVTESTFYRVNRRYQDDPTTPVSYHL